MKPSQPPPGLGDARPAARPGRRRARLAWLAAVWCLVAACSRFTSPSPSGTPVVEPGLTPPPAPTAAAPTVALTLAPSATPQPKALTLCLAAEPASLYAYRAYTGRAAHLAAEHVRQALFDGPIDPAGFTRRPVIVQDLPTVANGGVTLETVTVNTGDRYYDAAGDRATEWREAQTQMQRLVMTYTLREGLLWSDGQPLTAGDSVFAFELLAGGAADPAMQPAELPALAQRTAEYTALDDRTVRWIGLPGYVDRAPLASFDTFISPMPRHLLGEADPTQMAANPLAAREPIGWGPYVLTEWAEGESITFERNPLYFRAAEGLPRIDRLTFRFMPDPTQALDALTSLDWLDGQSGQAGACEVVLHDSFGLRQAGLIPSIDAAVAGGLLAAQYQADPAWEHLDFNLSPLDGRDAFFADPAVRQAVALCLDRQALADAIYAGHGVPALGLAPPGSPYLPPDAGAYFPHDPAAGRAALQGAGWSLGAVAEKDGLAFEVELLAQTGQPGDTLAPLIANDLAACGIRAVPRAITAEEMTGIGAVSPVFHRAFDLALFAWGGAPDGEPQCGLYVSSQIPTEENLWVGLNAAGYADPAYDAACAQARQTPGDAGQAAYWEAQRLLAQGLPSLPLFHRLQWLVSRPGVAGLTLEAIALDDLRSELSNIEELDLVQ